MHKTELLKRNCLNYQIPNTTFHVYLNHIYFNLYDFGMQIQDFKKYIILAVFDSVYRNGGHDLKISVVEDNYNVIATIDYQNPNGDFTSIMTQPFEIIKIVKTTKQVIFN